MSYSAWMEHAACAADENPDKWFSKRGSPEFKSAKHICLDVCPVRELCLTRILSMPAGDLYAGIWAGYTYNYLMNLRSDARREGRI